MTTIAETNRQLVYNFYLKALKASRLVQLQLIEEIIWRIIYSVLFSQTGILNFTTVNVEVHKLSEDINRWLYSQRQLVAREVKRSGIKDPRLPDIVVGLNTVQTRSVIGVFQQSPYHADRLAAKYRRQRANVIADTETVRWTASAKRIIWKDAQERGVLPIWAKTTWVNSKRANVCERCYHMNNQVATADGMFVTPEGFGIWTPPLHPNCHCDIRLNKEVTDNDQHYFEF